MASVCISLAEFLSDRQGRTFADVANDPTLAFAEVLRFFSDADRQRRLEESELHHDRAPLAGVVRELESLAALDQIFAQADSGRSKRLRQAIGVVVRMIMERRGWRKTGRKGSLGVRAAPSTKSPLHNTGGLAFWFIRAERYELKTGMPFRAVQQRCQELELVFGKKPPARASQKTARPVKRQRT